ncbi:hypothetical protein ACIGXM_20980 [Kitasatospora sp. NPDC052896]|uniref:hypothetical protein n=1 Tax=Kitasatospora sp. NPDC052896 TaxID=3364061 RepID=UPI0037C4FDBA
MSSTTPRGRLPDRAADSHGDAQGVAARRSTGTEPYSRSGREGFVAAGQRPWRWSIGTTFAGARTLLGVGQARNRSENAVRRTVPFGLYCYSITVVRYALHGHHPGDAADHRARAPWYTTKTGPSFADMPAELRRVITAARLLPVAPTQPTGAEVQDVRQALARAGLQHSA